MVLKMGLHPRVNATNQHTMVFHIKLPCDSPISQWNGCNDTAEDIAQRYSEVQSDGMW